MTGNRTSYPTGGDVQAFIEAAGLTVSDALSALLEGLANAAAGDFERAVDRVMLPEATASLRYFDPPVNRDGLLFCDDLAAAPTLLQYMPYGSSAQTLTLGTDYFLLPNNALAKGQPITQIRFRRRWTGPLSESLLQSLQITGRWGYCTTLPYEAWQAVCMRGAWLAWSQVTLGTTGGALSWKDGDRSVDYGVERWSGPLTQWCGNDGNGGAYGRIVGQYRRLSI